VNKEESINIKIHPRAFAAFGEELVTSDSVAILELVKNAYDAYALTVNLIFEKDKDGNPRIVIKDDGHGMTKDVIVNAWATIATPYKKNNPYVKRVIDGVEHTRIVSGNKGLGRFSAARLGRTMTMITKTEDGPAMEAYFDWELFNEIEKLDDCKMKLRVLDSVESVGTTIIIQDLNDNWDNREKLADLMNELSRLISPFEEINDFNVFVTALGDTEGIRVESKNFIGNPTYKIIGEVNEKGTIEYKYYFEEGNRKRENSGTIEWTAENYNNADLLHDQKELKKYSAGPYSFELRAWDMDAESLQGVSDRFEIGKRDIRASIKLYKGISVYRDKVLVLPKSEAGRDWLGLDAKRISQIGRRLSTNQIIGIVQISNERNPDIKDTTDREKLADTAQYKQFVETMLEVVDALQRERNNDKEEGKKGESLSEMLTPLSSGELVESVENAAKNGANAEELVKYIRDFHEKNELQLQELNERLIYYAQTASLGSVAIVIMHEILTGMTTIKRFLDRVKKTLPMDVKTERYYESSLKSHKRILEVTNSFAPLYKRDLRKRVPPVSLKEAVRQSFELISAKKMCEGVELENGISDDILVVVPISELQTVFINLFDNSCYWMQDNDVRKKISVVIEEIKGDRCCVSVNDTGKGIAEKDSERIFVPGVTSKPKGIGMGLVIVTEIIKSYGGKVGVLQPGKIGGASLVVDFPISETK
jgi:Signal transduction histidine kinase regulating C4-dicarboxylate transport system